MQDVRCTPYMFRWHGNQVKLDSEYVNLHLVRPLIPSCCAGEAKGIHQGWNVECTRLTAADLILLIPLLYLRNIRKVPVPLNILDMIYNMFKIETKQSVPSYWA